MGFKLYSKKTTFLQMLSLYRVSSTYYWLIIAYGFADKKSQLHDFSGYLDDQDRASCSCSKVLQDISQNRMKSFDKFILSYDHVVLELSMIKRNNSLHLSETTEMFLLG